MAELSCQLGEHVTCSPPKGAKSVVSFDHFPTKLFVNLPFMILPFIMNTLFAAIMLSLKGVFRSGTLGGKRVTFFREKWLDTQLMLRLDLVSLHQSRSMAKLFAGVGEHNFKARVKSTCFKPP